MLLFYVHRVSRGSDAPLARAIIPKKILRDEGGVYDRWVPLENLEGRPDVTGKLNLDVEIQPHPDTGAPQAHVT